MNFIIGLYYFLLTLVKALSKEIIVRAASIVFFPIAYALRWKIRESLYELDKYLIEERTLKNTQDISTWYFFNKVNAIYFFLWLFLDDSTSKDGFTNVREESYNESTCWDSSDTETYYPAFVYKHRVLRDIWWSFIRNNTVNLWSWYRTGGWVRPIQQTTYWGEFDENIGKNDSNTRYNPGYYLAKFKHNNGKSYIYFVYAGEHFGRKSGMVLGRSSGSGRWSFNIKP